MSKAQDDVGTDDEYEDLTNQSEDIPSLPIPQLPTSNQVPHKTGRVAEITLTEARWFYKDREAKLWTPFCGRDSLFVELAWQQYQDTSVDDAIIAEAMSYGFTFEEIVVLNGLYKVELVDKQIKPLYWEGEGYFIIRGTWFLPDENWQPIDFTLADRIEKEHMRIFVGQYIPERSPFFLDKGKKPVITTLNFDDYGIVWNSVVDIEMTLNSRLKRYMAFQFKSRKIRRRFFEDAKFEDGCARIQHLVFVVHGIGQKLQKNQIVMNAVQIRESAAELLRKNYETDPDKGIMFLPVEWRSNLILDEGLLESITPLHLESVRSLLNSTLMDILYYTSPIYRQQITNGLRQKFNSTFALFHKYNPDFVEDNGKISVIAHSLGSVISYDLITNWTPLGLYEKYIDARLSEKTKSLKDETTRDLLLQYQEARNQINLVKGGVHMVLDEMQEKLSFKVSTLFMLGSPLAVFLALRGNHGNADSVLPKQCRVINIFNKADAVAYRIEPLVHRTYARVRPVTISRFDADTAKTVSDSTVQFYGSEKQSPRTQSPRRDHLKYLEKLSPTHSNVDSANSSPLFGRKVKGEPGIKSWSESVLSRLPERVVGKLSTCTTSVTFSNVALCDNSVVESSMAHASDVKFDLDDGMANTSDNEENTDLRLSKKDGWLSSVWARLPERVTGRFSKPEDEKLTDLKEIDHISGELVNSISHEKLTEPENEEINPLDELTADAKLPYRIDYVLQPRRIDAISYLSALYAHISYWTDQDVVMFILSRILNEE